MSNKNEIVKIIKEKIKLNVPKIEIEKELVSKYKVEEFTTILASFPETELIQKYKNYNKFLIIFVAIATFLKLLSVLGMASEFGQSTILFFLLISLIIPIYIILGLLSFRKNAYGIMAAVCIFSLISYLRDPSEFLYISGVLSFILIIVTLFLSLFIRAKLYPKNIFKTETV